MIGFTRWWDKFIEALKILLAGSDLEILNLKKQVQELRDENCTLRLRLEEVMAERDELLKREQHER